jgi:hypothetical protein
MQLLVWLKLLITDSKLPPSRLTYDTDLAQTREGILPMKPICASL